MYDTKIDAHCMANNMPDVVHKNLQNCRKEEDDRCN